MSLRVEKSIDLGWHTEKQTGEQRFVVLRGPLRFHIYCTLFSAGVPKGCMEPYV